MVLGYVIMRVAMVFQWLRAARQDPARRRACLTYVIAISIAQVGWIAQIFLDFSVGVTFIFAGILALIELAGPVIAERRDGGTPWHAHHIAERYGLFAIIALGEGVVGTVATLVGGGRGAGLDPGCGAGLHRRHRPHLRHLVDLLHAAFRAGAARHRDRSFVWGYGQMILVAAIVATGAGLHVAAYFIEDKAHIGPLATLLTVAIPVGVFLGRSMRSTTIWSGSSISSTCGC